MNIKHPGVFILTLACLLAAPVASATDLICTASYWEDEDANPKMERKLTVVVFSADGISPRVDIAVESYSHFSPSSTLVLLKKVGPYDNSTPGFKTRFTKEHPANEKKRKISVMTPDGRELFSTLIKPSELAFCKSENTGSMCLQYFIIHDVPELAKVGNDGVFRTDCGVF